MVFNFSGENQVVESYKLSIIGVFVAIMLAALLLSSYRYQGELASYEQNELDQLTATAHTIESELSKALQSLEAIKRFADYSLNFPQDLPPSPHLKQDGQLFYLDKTRRDVIEHRQLLSVNITGVGDISSFDPLIKQELAMASTLTPAFITSQNTASIANWFSYVSLQRFVSLYPWIGSKNWQYTDRLVNNEYFNKVKLTDAENLTPVWAKPYIGTAGKSLYVGIALGVFRQDILTGAIVINIDLAKVQQKISDNVSSQYQYALINADNKLLVHLTADQREQTLNTLQNWQNVLPDELTTLNYAEIADKPASFKYPMAPGGEDGWLIQHHILPINGWMLVKYQQYDQFSGPIYQRFTWFFVILFLGQFALLTVVYLVTRKTFIKPTQKFISHISHSAKGDHGKIVPPKGWQHWFDLVGDIFSQNRSLLQQLKDQNNVLDIRVNEKTQALLEKSKQHQHDYAILRSVMDAIPDYLIFNDVNGQVIGCNLAFEKFIGQKELAILGKQAGKLVDNELGEALLHLNINVREKPSAYGVFQVIETVENTYELFTSEFYNQQHKVLGSIVVIRDVTTQYAINAALESAKEQAEQANKAKSQFLANMSHEIRTPINAIQGMQSLLQQTALTNQQRQHLLNAQGASDALLHLVDELLDFAKIESGNMSVHQGECCLDGIINQAVKLNINHIDPSQVKLNIDIAADVPYHIHSDEMRLVQVLSNLLNNAIKFTHQGEIALSVAMIADGKDESLIRFRVKDTGIGIEKSKQQHLFKAFVQADESMTRQYGGSGLGLSICQRIVNLLGGEIKLKSEFGEGAEFSFVLPIKVLDKPSIFDQQQAVTLFSVNYQLSGPFKQLFNTYDYHHYQLTDLESISGKHQTGINVLFLAVDEINESVCQLLVTELSCSQQQMQPEQRCMLAVCQQQRQFTNINEAYDLLDRFHIPYVICEEPLYRFALVSVLQAINTEQLPAPEALKPVTTINALESPVADLADVSVLLVEDNLVNQLVAKELLKAMKAEVVIAENGQQALALLEQQAFDVVLMDIQMPVMDGLTATKRIREQEKFKQLPIIAMTAHARQEDKDNSYQAGMNLHIAKPVKAEVLRSAILSVINV